MSETEKVAYDEISTKYEKSKELPFRKYIEQHTLFQLLGDLNGKTVLDLACGEGIYSRLMKVRGAKKVVGVDISQGMIDLARQRERQSPLGIEYIRSDASSLEMIEEFDIVLGSYLLNYAKTKDYLKRLAQGIYKNLKPGGRFVGINNNPFNCPKDFRSYRKYGFEKLANEPLHEGDPILYRLYNSDGNVFSFENFYLSSQSYEETFAELGFAWFAWRPLQLASEGVSLMEDGYWDVFMQAPPLIGLEAMKASGTE